MGDSRYCADCDCTVDVDVIPGIGPDAYHPHRSAIPPFVVCSRCGWCFGSDEQDTAHPLPPVVTPTQPR